MPAIITHHIFGETLLAQMPAELIESEEERLAFLLANQGPDPFFARFSTSLARMKTAHSFAHRMHEERMTRAFSSLYKSVSHLPAGEARLGRSFALGMLAHWQLDSVCHPFVYAQQYALCASDTALKDRGGEIHALIESDIDSWMLWTTRHATVEEYPPAAELARTQRIGLVAGALLSHVALDVFNISLGAEEYEGAVSDFELMYKAIEPAGSSRSMLLASIEKLFRDSSRLLAQAHKVVRNDTCAAANLSHAPWTDPDTTQTKTESFSDLFELARMQWDESMRAFISGNERDLANAIAGRNYNGIVVTDN